MHRVLLTFRNPETERQYDHYTTHRLLRGTDLAKLYLSLSILSVGFYRDVFKTDSMGSAIPRGLGVLFLLWQLRLQRSMTPAELTATRTRRILLWRCVLEGIRLASTAIEVNVPQSAFLLMSRTGLAPGLLFAITLRLKFVQHILYQIVASMLSLCWTANGICSSMMGSSSSAGVVSVCASIKAVAERILRMMYEWFGLDVSGPLMVCPCLHLTVWMHTYILLVVVPYVVWMLERNSRLAFIETLPYNRRRQEGLLSVCRIPRVIVGHHIGLLVIAFAVMWNVNYPIVKIVNSWGMG